MVGTTNDDKDVVLKETLDAVSELLIAVIVVISPLSPTSSAKLELRLLVGWVGWEVADIKEGVVPPPGGNKVVSAARLLLVSVVETWPTGQTIVILSFRRRGILWAGLVYDGIKVKLKSIPGENNLTIR